MPYKSYYLTTEGELRKELSEEQIKAAFDSKEGLLWVDIGDTTPEDGHFLERVFDFHPLPIQDCVDPAIHNPSVEDYGDHLFMILRGINYTVEMDILQTTELGLFLGQNFVVSNHNVFLFSLDAIAKMVESNGPIMMRGAVFLAHALIDALVDNIIPTLDRLGERLDDIEDIILEHPHPSSLQAIMALKRSSLRLRRAMVPQRQVLAQLSRREFTHISDEALYYFRDVYDNIVHIEGTNENLRERADTALATYLSVVANRQNETMKLLSMITAIFLPLTLVAGIYGMNFEHMPELMWRWGYFAVLGFMATVICAVVWYFWARSWIYIGRRRLERFAPTAVESEKLVRYLGHIARRRRV
ncbi:MAG: magnesium/cobalt transporter CorA [Ardenticatenaceae bacterium]